MCLFVDEVKALGGSPQRMIVALEEMAAERRARATEHDSFDDQVADVDVLVADLVAGPWSGTTESSVSQPQLRTACATRVLATSSL